MVEAREGEIRLGFDPTKTAADATLIFIGIVRSAWTKLSDCPKNMREARSRGQQAELVVFTPFRPGLSGLQSASHVAILTWLHHAPRDLIIQNPRHIGRPRGTFTLRSPARPNPVGLHIVKLLDLDADAGTLKIDAIDVLDETPLIDIKPYFASTDAIAGAIIKE